MVETTLLSGKVTVTWLSCKSAGKHSFTLHLLRVFHSQSYLLRLTCNLVFTLWDFVALIFSFRCALSIYFYALSLYIFYLSIIFGYGYTNLTPSYWPEVALLNDVMQGGGDWGRVNTYVVVSTISFQVFLVFLYSQAYSNQIKHSFWHHKK